MKIVIVYFSKTGTIKTLVQHAQRILSQYDVDLTISEIKASEIIHGRYTNNHTLVELRSSDGMIFATPTYFGGVPAQFKSFLDATSIFWQSQLLAGKLLCGITSGGYVNGDQTHTLQYLQTFANQQGMLWVPLGLVDERYGVQSGISVVSNTRKSLKEEDFSLVGHLVTHLHYLLKMRLHENEQYASQPRA